MSFRVSAQGLDILAFYRHIAPLERKIYLSPRRGYAGSSVQLMNS